MEYIGISMLSWLIRLFYLFLCCKNTFFYVNANSI